MNNQENLIDVVLERVIAEFVTLLKGVLGNIPIPQEFLLRAAPIFSQFVLSTIKGQRLPELEQWVTEELHSLAREFDLVEKV